MEISSLRRFCRARKDYEFKYYLKNYVQNSSDELNPDRSCLKDLKFTRKEMIRRHEDTILWRLRVGHNRTKHHLARLKIKEDGTCRYCKSGEEDGFHLIVQCTSIPRRKEFEDFRYESGITSREEWNWWLYSDDEFVQSQRKSLMKLLLQSSIEI